MKQKQIWWSVISFVLLFPFRLPIAVLFIRALNAVAQSEGTALPYGILTTNVVITKLVYDIIFAGLLAINVYKLCDPFINKWDNEGKVAFVVFAICTPLVTYITYDCISAYSLSVYLLGLK